MCTLCCVQYKACLLKRMRPLPVLFFNSKFKNMVNLINRSFVVAVYATNLCMPPCWSTTRSFGEPYVRLHERCSCCRAEYPSNLLIYSPSLDTVTSSVINTAYRRIFLRRVQPKARRTRCDFSGSACAFVSAMVCTQLTLNTSTPTLHRCQSLSVLLARQ